MLERLMWTETELCHNFTSQILDYLKCLHQVTNTMHLHCVSLMHGYQQSD